MIPHLANLKTLRRQATRHGALLAVVTAGLAATTPLLRAAKDGAPAYYAASEIPAPAEYSGSQDRAVVVTMNDQGYAIVTNGFSSGGSILVYLKDHYLKLSTAGLNLSSPTAINATHLSNVAADGSFNVSGEADFADGFHRVVFWHVNADGTNAAQMMKNRVLPENSQQPGEQHSASAVAVNSSGVIAGNVQSYLAGLGAFWYPPDPTPNSPFDVYQGPSDLDEAGNFSGERSAGAGSAAQYNNGDLNLLTNIDSRAYRLKNGRIAGEYVLPDYSDHTFVYDVTAGTYAELPVYDPTSTRSENQQVKFLDNAGDAIGESYSPNVNAYFSDLTLWKRDPNTGAYTAYNIQQDIVGPVYTDSYLNLVRNGSSVGALLADGTFVLNGVNDLYNNNPNAIVVFKPGADPRPVVNLPVGSSSYFTFHADPGQPFSYQFTATNNPTAFALVNSDKTPYVLPPGLSFNPATGVLSGRTTEIQTYYFNVQATNGQGVGILSKFVLFTSGEPPVITSAATASGKVGQAFSFQVMATNSPSSFYFTNLPGGLTFDHSTGLISGTPTTAGSFVVTEQVDNAISGGFGAYPSGTGTLTITITDTPVVPDAITSPATASGTVGKIFAYQILANFANPTAYDAVGLPNGLSVNQTTGLISGQPTQFATGAHTVEIYASNDDHDASLTLTITIAAAPTNAGTADLTLTVVDSPDPVVVGGTVRYTFTLANKGPNKATGIQGNFVKDSKMTLVSSGSTPGVLVNGNVLNFPLPDLASGLSETFVLAFTADAAGVYTVGAGVQADQTDPHTADNGLLETTEAKAGSTAAHAPVITAPPGGQIVAGEAFRYQITTDGTVTVDTYTATGLPDGLSVDGATGLISGSLPATTAAGPFTVTLRAANGAGASTTTRTFTVVAAPTGDKTVDVTVAFGADTSIKLVAAKGKYKFTGSVTLSNLGTKAFNGVSKPGQPPKTPLAVGLYLSNSPTFSYPLTGDPTAAGLLPLAVNLTTTIDPKTGIVSYSAKVSVPKPGKSASVINLPVKLAKGGKNPLNVPFTLGASAEDLPAQVLSGQYRYVLVVLDPAGAIPAELSKSNNTAMLDLQALLGGQ